MVADGCTYPVCTIKNRMQARRVTWLSRAAAALRRCAAQAQGGARAGTYAYRGPVDALRTIVRTVRAVAALTWR